MIGLIGKKLGMTQIFDNEGSLTPVTIIVIEPNVVIARRNEVKDGYEAAVLGSLIPKHISKPVAGQFKEEIKPLKHLVEFRNFPNSYSIGETLGVEIFDKFRYVDVIGTSKGKGFQGVMKRHNFHGGPAGHGSKFKRANGSTGMAAWPSKVIKGTKMPGRMGSDRKTVQNLKIVKIDSENNVLLIKGAVPGTRNSLVVVRQAKKRV